MKAKLIIELGGSYITIYKKKSGLVLKEPSLIAVKKSLDGYEILANGQAAKTLETIGDETITVFSPFSEGKIKSLQYAQALLKNLLKKVDLSKAFLDIGAIVVVSNNFDFEQKQSYDQLLKAIGIKPLYYIPSIFGVLLYNNEKFDSQAIFGVLDIGSTTTDIGLLQNHKLHYGSSINLGGRAMTLAVKNHLEKNYNLKTTSSASAELKESLANLTSFDNSVYEIKGVDLSSGEERIVLIKAPEIRELLLPYFEQILNQITFLLNDASDEVLRQIKVNGLILSGQVSKTVGCERFFKEKLQVPVRICNDTENASVLGFAPYMKNKEYLSKIAYK